MSLVVSFKDALYRRHCRPAQPGLTVAGMLTGRLCLLTRAMGPEHGFILGEAFMQGDPGSLDWRVKQLGICRSLGSFVHSSLLEKVCGCLKGGAPEGSVAPPFAFPLLHL